MAQPKKPLIRMMRPSVDKGGILRVEHDCYDNPWTNADFDTFLAQHGCHCLVIEMPGQGIVGFILYEECRVDAHIHSFGIVKPYRRKKFGTQLLKGFMDRILRGPRTQVRALVHETNLTALSFLKSIGFKASLVLRDYYEEDHRDAIQMDYHRGNTEDPETCVGTAA